MTGMFGAIILVLTAHQCLAQPPGVPPHTGQPSHGHGHGGKPLEFASEVHNRDHILEHLQSVIATKSKDEMTEEELEFHYFKLHDYDNNNKLDGVEIGKALTHFHDEAESSPDKEQAKVFPDEEIANIVDSVLSENDANGDGYIEYFEFKKKQSEQRAAQPQNGQQNQQQQQHHP